MVLCAVAQLLVAPPAVEILLAPARTRIQITCLGGIVPVKHHLVLSDDLLGAQADLQSEPSSRHSAEGDVHSLLSAAVEDALFRPSADGDARDA